MQNDVDLIQRVAQGDRQAFLSIYDRYNARVHGLSRYMLQDEMTAEENTQDAFLKLWTRADTFRSERGSLLTWLLTITRRLALDRIRLAGRRPQLHNADPSDTWHQLPDPKSEGDEFRWQTVRLTLTGLPPEQRQVIEASYYYGLSQRQIADQFAIPLGTVKTRMRLGMAKLREALTLPPEVAQDTSNPGPGGV